MSSADEDRELVRRSRSGDAEAFGTLVRRYERRLRSTVQRLIGPEMDVADVLQDAFLLAFDRIDRFQGTSSFYTWMYRIAVNAALTARRSRRRVLSLNNGSTSSDPASGLTALEPVDLRDQSDPSWSLQRREICDQVQQALARLGPDHRTIVVLKDLEEKSYDEIAEILGIAVGTVRSRLHRARLELKRILNELGDVPYLFDTKSSSPSLDPVRSGPSPSVTRRMRS